MPEWQLHDDARGVVVRLVILAQTPLGVEIVDVLRGRRGAVGEFERLRAVVLRLRQRERIRQANLIAHAPLVPGLETVVPRLPTTEDVRDVAESRNGPLALRE